MLKPGVRGWGCALGVCAALLVCKVAKADFQWALSQFDAGHYEAAHAEFLALAALGNGNAQYNLGAMSLKGQAGPASKGTGVGWLLAAAENGYAGLTAEKLQSFKASLSEAELHDAQQVLDVYGHEALLRTTLPSGNLVCPGLASDRPRPTNNDAIKEFTATHTAVILVGFTVGADGHLRDPEIHAVISDMTADALAPPLFELLFRSRWLPETLNKVPLDRRVTIIVRAYKSSDGATWQIRQMDKLRAAAEAGDVDAAYLFSALGEFNARQAKKNDTRDFMLIAAQAGHPKAAHELGRRFDGLSLCNKGEDPRKFPWLRYAAAAGETSADLDLARALLNQAPSPEQLPQIRNLLQGAATSDSFRAKKYAVALLAASPLEAIRLPPVALAGARALTSGPIQSDPQMFEAVAAAQAANGDFAQAEAQQQAALAKAKALGWNTRLIEERLDAYRNKKAWYGDIFAMPPP